MKRSCRVRIVLQFPTAHCARVPGLRLMGTGETCVMKQPLRLRGISGDVKGKVWESESLLRAGRLGTLEIVLDDSSVSRRHAEVRNVDSGWWVRDLDSTNGTYVNGVRLGNGERQLHARDIIQFG